MHDSTSVNDPMWLVQEHPDASGNPDGQHIDVVKMTNVLSSTPTFTTTTLAVNPYAQVVQPLQPDGSGVTPTLDSRVMKAAEQGGTLVAAHAVSNAAGNQDLVRWYQIDLRGAAPVLHDQGDVGSGPNTYLYFPGIDINPAGDIGMSYIQSGTDSPDDFMSMYVTGRAPADPLGTMEAPVLAQAGQQVYEDFGPAYAVTQRAGDLSAINVDSAGNFWALNEFADDEALPTTPDNPVADPSNPAADWSTNVVSFTVPTRSSNSATFLKSDGTTQGYWEGAYGGDGYNVIDGGAPAYPSYATVTPSGNGDYVWQSSTIDPRALQKPANPVDHVAAMWYSTTGFTVDVNITDGQQHQVALYLLDWDGGGGRSERIDVLDVATGKVLDSRTASGFGGGEYLVWSLGGHVQIRITRLSGPNAVLSGLFFGPGGTPPSGDGSAAFLKSDGTTQGSWQGAYGGDGYNVVDAGAPSYPPYATVTPVGPADYVWQASTSDPRALQKPANPSDRIAAAWYSASGFSIDLNLTGGAHQVALYLLDWDGGNRSEQIDVVDAVTGKLLDSQTVGGFGGGEYLVWDLGGNVLVRITRQSGPNAVLSGLFFDPTA
jgi:hypothetical protein